MIDKRIKVLVVDDDVSNTLIVQEMLTEDRTGQKYDTVPAHRLLEALALMEHHTIDVILLDLGFLIMTRWTA